MMGKAEEGTRSTPSKDGCFIKKKKKKTFRQALVAGGRLLRAP